MNIGRSKILQSAKYTEQKRKKRILLYSIVLSICAISLVLIVLVLNINSLRVKTIEFTGIHTLNVDELRENIFGTISGKYFGILPKSNILLYSKDNISKGLIDSYKKIENIEIKTQGVSSVLISIKERKPNAIVCDGFKEDLLSQNTEGLCYEVDADGYLYGTTTSNIDSVIKIYINSENILELGSNFIDKDLFHKLSNFINDILEMGIRFRGLLITDEGGYELYFINNDESNGVLYFDNKTPFDKTLSNFKAFWQVNNKKNFEYINLRFGNNIFYIENKDKNNEQ